MQSENNHITFEQENEVFKLEHPDKIGRAHV